MPFCCRNISGRRFAAAFALSLAFLTPVSEGRADDGYASASRRTQSLLDAGDYPGAQREADTLAALARTPQERADAALLWGKASYHRSDYRQARDRLLDAVRLSVAADGENSARHAAALTSLGAAYRGLAEYDSAEDAYRQALAIMDALPSADPGSRADLLTSRAVSRFYAGDLDRAEALTREALAIRRSRSSQVAELAQALDNLGTILQGRGLLVQAEGPLDEALALRRENLRAGHPDIANSLNNIGVLRYARGDYRGAEKVLREALAIDVSAYGEQHPQVLTDLQNLAEALRALRQLDEALDIHMRVLRQRTADAEAQGRDTTRDLDLAVSHGNLANVLSDLGNDEQALAHLEAALSIDRARTAGVSRDVPLTLNNIGELRLRKDGPTAAIAVFSAALDALGRADLPDDALHAGIRFNLASARLALGDVRGAEELLREVKAFRQTHLPDDHPERLATDARLAFVVARLGASEEAVRLVRSTLAGVRARLTRSGLGTPAGYVEAEARTTRMALEDCLSALAASAAPSGLVPSGLENDVVEATEAAHTTATAVVVGRMAVRRSAATPESKDVARQLAEAVERRELASRRDARAAGGLTTSEAPASLGTVAAIDAEISELRKNLPGGLQDIVSPTPSSQAIREHLRTGEVVLSFVVGNLSTTAVSIGSDALRVWDIPAGRTALKTQIDRIRAGLTWSDTRGGFPQFDLAAARALGDLLVAPLEGAVPDTKRLAVVADGPLTEIPLAILVRRMPEGLPTNATDERRYQAATWLGDRFAVALFPDLASLLTLGGVKASARSSFIGFGNPTLAPVPETSAADLFSKVFALQGTGPGLDEIRHLPSLPQTSTQLAVMNRIFGDGQGRVLEGGLATEGAVRSEDLSRYRFVAFATHGLQPADTGSLAEPALVLTPPANPSPDDDGLLSASEIGRLRLDADLILLSACNTATPRAGYGSDGLSGLARAFFQAGARAVLISHWQVEAYAATALMEHLVASTDGSMAVALAEAERGVRHVPDGRFAHPGFWAPFSLVGDAAPPALGSKTIGQRP